MDKYEAIGGASGPALAERLAQIEDVIHKLEEMQIRMSIIVYDRRTIRRLVGEVEAGYAGMSGQLTDVLTAARRHLECSEEYEEVENQVRWDSAKRQKPGERLQPLLTRAYETWREWQAAHTACLHHLSSMRYTSYVDSLDGL